MKKIYKNLETICEDETLRIVPTPDTPENREKAEELKRTFKERAEALKQRARERMLKLEA